jgi:hypothetical protein
MLNNASSLFIKNPDSSKASHKDAQEGGKGSGSAVPVDDLVQGFDNLALSGGGNQSDHFVGGFHPRYHTVLNSQPYTASSTTSRFDLPIPVPPAMPIPYVPKNGRQSLTMQMALRPPNAELLSPYQSTLNSRSHPVTHAPFAPVTASVSAPRPVPLTAPSAPVKHQRPRAASSPGISSVSEQCAGITKANKQCSRRVKLGPALTHLYDDNDDYPPPEVFCHQHQAELLHPSGFFSRKTRKWIAFKGRFLSVKLASPFKNSQIGYPTTSVMIRRLR